MWYMPQLNIWIFLGALLAMIVCCLAAVIGVIYAGVFLAAAAVWTVNKIKDLATGSKSAGKFW